MGGNKQKEERRKVISKKRTREKHFSIKKKETLKQDLTWGKRRMKWRFEEIARKVKRKRNRVWSDYGKLRINVQWWR